MSRNSDMRGLSEKGKKDYPRFTREQVETKQCELCTAIKTVKKYNIIKKSGNSNEMFLCDGCIKLVPTGVKAILLEKPKIVRTKIKVEEELKFKIETNEGEGDTLLL